MSSRPFGGKEVSFPLLISSPISSRCVWLCGARLLYSHSVTVPCSCVVCRTATGKRGDLVDARPETLHPVEHGEARTAFFVCGVGFLFQVPTLFVSFFFPITRRLDTCRLPLILITFCVPLSSCMTPRNLQRFTQQHHLYEHLVEGHLSFINAIFVPVIWQLLYVATAISAICVFSSCN